MSRGAAVLTPTAVGNDKDIDYRRYLVRVDKGFVLRTAGAPVFTTDATDLWATYLKSFPDAEERQFHDCRACRRFIEHYGGLVTIDEAGRTHPAVWNITEAYGPYIASTMALAKLVSKAKVTGVFYASEDVWGSPITGRWQHYHVNAATPYRRSVLTANQAMAEKREDYKNVMASLDDFSVAVLDQAIRLLDSEALYRSEKILGAAKWLRELRERRDSAPRGLAANVCWRMIGSAPAGFCHPRGSMIGTLLEDIAAGKDFEAVKKSFAAKMHPLQYQRPQAPPKAGTITQAEKLFQDIKAGGSLARRFARPDEVVSVWKPQPPQPTTKRERDAIFGHLKPAAAKTAPYVLPPQDITWVKFCETVLPSAGKIEYSIRPRDNYAVLVTAVHPDSPAIIQWDREDDRNPMSWYLWNGGSYSAQYGLKAGDYHPVSAVTYKPSMWGGGQAMDHQGSGVVFLLEGAHETRDAGSALFPEILKSDFHGIRSVIEAHSRTAPLADTGDPHCVGPMFFKGSKWDARLRVTSKGQTAIYDLDRWD